MMLSSIPVEELPELIQVMVGAVGATATTALVQGLGGSTVRFPKCGKGKTYDVVVKLIGKEKAESLRHIFNKEVIYLPSLKTFRAKARQREIIRRYDDGGVTGEDLAVEFGVSVRWVYAILNQERI
ncbi:MAG: hypothetical protein HQL54_13310 [Magnetococcales bacterium]|nr:hypothetical protein [Magnetococcales bacterium]